MLQMVCSLTIPVVNSDGSRLPSRIELDGAKYVGRKVAETAAKLAA